MKNSLQYKVRNWKELEDVSKKVIIDGVETLIVPMGYHGLKKSKIVLNDDDEIKQAQQYQDEHKFSTTGTILLIGTGY